MDDLSIQKYKFHPPLYTEQFSNAGLPVGMTGGWGRWPTGRYDDRWVGALAYREVRRPVGGGVGLPGGTTTGGWGRWPTGGYDDRWIGALAYRGVR